MSNNKCDEIIWEDLYADRANNLRASEIRALFAVVSRPEVVSLAGGMPNIHDLPLTDLSQTYARLIADKGEQALQYCGGQGWLPIREKIVEVMAEEGFAGNPENVVITTGSQQALDLVTQIFVNPGDVVLVESPSYVGALGVFNAAQADVVHVEMDNDGIIPEQLEEAIVNIRKHGKNIKFLYTVPNYHNPAGICLSLERRPKIVEICERYNVVILEDNPYGLLGFDNTIRPTLVSQNPDSVIYLGSFSKIFAPGFRIGWAHLPDSILSKMVVASESAILCPAMIGQMGIYEYLCNFDWRNQIKIYRNMYQERCETTMKALATYLPQCSWTVPAGGFYTWLKLPEGINSKAMLTRAVDNLVAYTPGTAFYADGNGKDFLRICYSYPACDVITEGVKRLAKTIEEEQKAL